jgi:16S rRNA G966 N2-methylase RsmD
MNKIHEITKQLRLSSIEVYLFHIDPSHLERFSLILIDPPYPTRFFLTLINSSYLEEILSDPNRSN